MGVTLYTTEPCGYCRVAKALLDKRNIPYEEVNLARDPDGVQGTFQNEFLVHLREGEPCGECGRTIRKLRAAGRGTYVCERCQPRPRARRAQARA